MKRFEGFLRAHPYEAMLIGFVLGELFRVSFMGPDVPKPSAGVPFFIRGKAS